MKNKRGQFYLIASLAIIALVAGFFLIGNSSKAQENPRVKDVAEELEIEGGKILDRGAVSGNYNWDEFAGNFSEYSGDVDIVYIVGTRSSHEVFKYDNDVKNASITNSFDSLSNVASVIYDGADYDFQMRMGENFYYIVSQHIGEEKYVARN